MTRSRLVELKTLTKELDIRFRSYELLNLALTHRSVISKSHHKLNNERLEFLGDSVLGLAVTEYLYLKFPNSKEGDLAKIKSYVVSEEVLSQIGFNIGLDRFLLIGKGEEASGGRKKKAILEDAFEALLGAYYLDVGYKKSKSFILSLLAPEIDKVLDGDYKKDYKTIFQEYIQKKRKVCPKYKLLRKSGPDHDTMFIYQVIVSGEVMGTGRGKSRKIAEQSAAKTAYKKIIETP
ncbi:ribonuclease III [Thiospirochaeta perfilievii]|uniref:ribonuclease III n=1 Tax=Thiospirochaeta perfilievii TaxID=252967 RepID=UPI001FEE849F|nr:ribonuclease III [Thiospirochaeta perfilievii]